MRRKKSKKGDSPSAAPTAKPLDQLNVKRTYSDWVKAGKNLTPGSDPTGKSRDWEKCLLACIGLLADPGLSREARIRLRDIGQKTMDQIGAGQEVNALGMQNAIADAIRSESAR